jgi:hypothetical protein
VTFLTIYQLLGTSEQLFYPLKQRFETTEVKSITVGSSAFLLLSTIDARDYAYVRGVRMCLPDGSHRLALVDVLVRVEAEGWSGADCRDR